MRIIHWWTISSISLIQAEIHHYRLYIKWILFPFIHSSTMVWFCLKSNMDNRNRSIYDWSCRLFWFCLGSINRWAMELIRYKSIQLRSIFHSGYFISSKYFPNSALPLRYLPANSTSFFGCAAALQKINKCN